jgi:hypothetical protein
VNYSFGYVNLAFGYVNDYFLKINLKTIIFTLNFVKLNNQLIMKKKAKNLQKGTFEVLTKTHLLKIKGGILYPNPPTNPTGPARNH